MIKKIFALCFLCTPLFAVNITLHHVHGAPFVQEVDGFTVTLTQKAWQITKQETSDQIFFNMLSGALGFPDIKQIFQPRNTEKTSETSWTFFYENAAGYAKIHVKKTPQSASVFLYIKADQVEPTHTFKAIYATP